MDKKSHSCETPNKGSTESAQTGDPKEILKNLRLKNVNRLICAQLNINSLRNKFESLINIINNNIDILMISETKLDISFPTGQFHIHGFSEPYRFDRNSSGGGILLYIREDIPSKLILTKMTIEGFFVEINLRKKRWLLCCSYNPKKPLISEHLNEIGKNLDLLLSKYDNFMLIGDLNAEPTEAAVSDFCEIYNLKHLIKDKTCFKNPTKPTCIDLIVTNRPKCFQDTVVFETGLSDFHKMSVTVMKMYYAKQKPSIVHYRKFKDFCNDSFIKDTELLLSKLCDQQNVPFKILKESVNITLEKHAPLKKRYVRANQSPFMNKKLSKEIMKRSRLRNKFLNTKSDIDRKAYNKQRNYVVSLLRNEKKNFYSNLDTKIVIDNRTFWKTVKPFLSEKITKHSKINLVEDDKITFRHDQIAKKFQ